MLDVSDAILGRVYAKIKRCLKKYLYLKLVESYILHAPDSPDFKVAQCKHVESIKAPKYIGAGIPATIKGRKKNPSTR